MAQFQGSDMSNLAEYHVKLKVKSYDSKTGIVTTVDDANVIRRTTLDELYMLEAEGRVLLTNAVMFHNLNGTRLVKSNGTAVSLSEGLYAWDDRGTPICDMDLLDDAYKVVLYGGEERTDAILHRLPNVEELILPDLAKLTFRFGEYMGSLRYISCYGCQEVNSRCFAECASLAEVFLPNVVSIFESAFRGSGIRRLSLSHCVEIGVEAFKGCTRLEDVDLPACDCLSDSVFMYCDKLQSVRMPLCVSAGKYAFASCEHLTSVELPILRDLGSHAFQGCISLTKVSFPSLERVLNVYEGAVFKNCYKLQSVCLGKITDLYRDMFLNCVNLTEINCPLCENVLTGALRDCEKLENFDFSRIIAIMEDAFSGTSVRYVFAPKCLRIELRAFANCKNLSYVSAPRCEYVGASAFAYSSIEVAKLDSLNLLFSYVFKDCRQLHYCEVATSTVTIYPQAFVKCPALEYGGLVNSEGHIPEIDWEHASFLRYGRISELAETPLIRYYQQKAIIDVTKNFNSG